MTCKADEVIILEKFEKELFEEIFDLNLKKPD